MRHGGYNIGTSSNNPKSHVNLKKCQYVSNRSFSPMSQFKKWAYIYKGCFIDTHKRDLNGPRKNDATMTLEKCHDFCKLSYLYFGAQVIISQPQ